MSRLDKFNIQSNGKKRKLVKKKRTYESYLEVLIDNEFYSAQKLITMPEKQFMKLYQNFRNYINDNSLKFAYRYISNMERIIIQRNLLI
jgi:hypothetical protein